MLNLYPVDLDTTFRKCIRIQNPVEGTNSWSVGKVGATWRRRVVLISTGRTERLSQRLTKLKPKGTVRELPKLKKTAPVMIEK